MTKKKECLDLYNKTYLGELPKTKVSKSRIRGKWGEFYDVLSGLTEHQKEVIATTPFASLLAMENEVLSVHLDLIKSIVSHVNCDTMTLTVRKGSKTKDFSIIWEDFSKIMGIEDVGGLLVQDGFILDNGLIEKYCSLTNKTLEYKFIDIGKVKDILKEAVDDNVIKQTFAIIAMCYIVCPPLTNNFGKKFLWYVKNAQKLHEQPWAHAAMEALRKGIKTYDKGKRVEKS